MDIPFIYGRLAEKESFIDRVEDRRELKNFLRHGINVILVSPRRWGKSSLVRTSMEELMQEESKTKVCFMDASKIHTEEEFYNKFASIVIQGVSSTLEQKLSDLVKFINRFTPSITIASDPMNSVEVNLKVNPVKESPENILQLPERIAEAKGIKIIVNPFADKNARKPNAIQSAFADFFNGLNAVRSDIREQGRKVEALSKLVQSKLNL